MTDIESIIEPAELEEWRPITGYEGVYSVSNFGRVRIDTSYHVSRIGHIFKPQIDKGYCFVLLGYRSPRKRPTVHGLVARAFLGECPTGLQVNHKDGNKQNNRADNLEYLSPSENTRHAVQIGLRGVRDKHPRAKLTAEEALYIRQHYNPRNSDFNTKALTKRFNISQSTLWNVVNGRHWTTSE